MHRALGSVTIAGDDRSDDREVLGQRDRGPTRTRREPELVSHDLTTHPVDDQAGDPVPADLSDPAVQAC